MKYLLALVLSLAVVLCGCFAATGTATVTFLPSDPAPVGGEYFVEQKQSDGTWVEVAKGPASPIIFDIPNLRAGEYVMRVRARVVVNGITNISPPSNEAPAVVVPGAPGSSTSTVVKK